MNSQLNDVDAAHSARRKGKCRAAPEEASESTPLLGSSAPLIQDAVPSPTSSRRRRRLCVLLTTVFLSTLGLCLIIVVILFAIAYSYDSKITNAVRDEVLDRAVVMKGPDRVDVLNATEGSVWVQVEMRIGVDAGTAIDVVLEAGRGKKMDMGATSIQRSLSRWFVRRMHSVTVSADKASIFSGNRFLANISVPPVTLPLTLDRPEHSSWLTKVVLPIHVNLTDDAEDLTLVAQETWKNGVLSISTIVCGVSVNGGGQDETSWRRRLIMDEDIITVLTHMRIPKVPGLPAPGKGTPFPGLSDLITLESFNVSSSNHGISIKASASLIDPFPTSLQMRIPSVPFFVSLFDTHNPEATVTVTTGQTEPFSLNHPNITVRLSGTVPPLPRSSSPLLSSFLSAYLAGIDAPILVGSPLLPTLKFPALFPAPHPKPQILQDVHIRNMHISLRGENVLASGTIYAHVILPSGINVIVDAKKIWPDVIVFDGEVPSQEEETNEEHVIYDRRGTIMDNFQSSLPSPSIPNKDEGRATIPKDPLPSPLPVRAFARIRPDDWIPSHSEPIPSSDGAYEVTAEVVDVPLEVLPGRDHLLRSFVSKVLFSGKDGALAGVNGTAAVAVAVDGLPVDDGDGDEDEDGDHVFELTGLPFSGNVRVGRKGL